MFSRFRYKFLAALGALIIVFSSVAAEAGGRRHGGNHHWGFRLHHHGHGHWRPHYWRPHYWRPSHWRSHHHYRGPRYVSGDRAVFGGLIGAVLGGFLGSHIGKGAGNFAAIVGGVTLGAVIGGNIGRGMDQTDHAATGRVLETSRTGNTVRWRNMSTGSVYEVTPVRTYHTSDQRVCREFSSWAKIDGNEERLYSTACRLPDGSWERVS